ncbi:transposase [Streptomyces sp. NPDC005728]|uniref:transposase n=1 Tax=Streptomyces sp. NPDC005728 TaxID=3157054 RepID=UPI0033CBB081
MPRRWVVERSFGWLVRNRRLARDYERLTATSKGTQPGISESSATDAGKACRRGGRTPPRLDDGSASVLWCSQWPDGWVPSLPTGWK